MSAPKALYLSAAVLLICGSTRAETIVDRTAAHISDAAAQSYLADALTKVHLQKCEQDSPCAPLSRADADHPPLTLVETRTAMVQGAVSALAQWCGLNWHRSFVPMISQAKNKLNMTDRQLTLMTLIHGNMHGRQLEKFRREGSCSDKVRAQVDAELPKDAP